MREFNTSGPCNPALHYTVMREALIAIGKEKVRKGRFFTLFAPRQSGKTTYFQLLLEELKDEYTPIWISFEDFQNLTRIRFYERLKEEFIYEFASLGIKIEHTITDAIDIARLFEYIPKELCKPIVLVIDEFEGIPSEALNEVMHTFRKMYHKKDRHRLHSLILVGVSTIAELVLTSASPFNIADELNLPYLAMDEVHDLIQQYVTESGQLFDAEVINAIYENTQGQPGLVCALCHYLTTEGVPDKSQPITMEAWYPTLDYFLTQRQDKNILNIVQKAREKQLFMLRLLFSDDPIPFSVDVPDIAWLYAHGVIDVIDGHVGVSVPLYAKRLIKAFTPVINGEKTYYLTSAHDSATQYVQPDGRLNVNALLQAYRAYVRRRGFRAFDTENLREAACHYSLDGFITFSIQQLGGQTYIEVPSGRGQMDLLIRYDSQSYIIEIKVFSTPTRFKQGKAQLAAYLQSEGLDEGYYVVFSSLHTEADDLYTEEVLDGKRIFTHIILTNVARPSELPVPQGGKS